MTNEQPKQNGKDPAACSHPRFRQERIMGAGTGDYECVECGLVVDRHERERIEAAKASKPD
jgi:hypothetical protein